MSSIRAVLGRPLPAEKTERLLRPAVVIPLALAVALFVRMMKFVGICRLDMFKYLELSDHVLRGGSLFDPQVFFAAARLPLMMPLIWSNRLFGYSELASVGWPLVCSLISVVLAYVLARELFDDTTAFAAAMLMAVFPLEVELATQLLPDAIEGMFVLAAATFAVLAARSERRWRLLAVLAGASLGMAYYTRVNALVFLPGLLAVGAILRPSSWRRSLWVLVGLAAAAALFALAFWGLSGDPLVDIHKSQQTYSDYSSSGFIVRADSFAGLIRKEPALYWMLPLAPLALLGAALRRDRGVALLGIWIVGFYVYLEWVSRLHGLDSSYRYIEPLVPAFLVLVGLGAAELVRGKRLWRLAAVAAVGVLAMALMFRTSGKVARRYNGHPRWQSMRVVARELAENPERTLFVDHSWHLVAVNYYGGYRFGRDTLEPAGSALNAEARLFKLGEPGAPQPEPGSWLLLSEKTPAPPAGADLVREYPYSEGKLGLYDLD